MKAIKPLIFLVDDRGGFWTHAAMRCHWERWADVFEVVPFPNAATDIADQIVAVITAKRRELSSRPAFLVTDAKMQGFDGAGLALVEKVVVKSGAVDRAVIYSLLAEVSPKLADDSRVHAERSVGEPSVLPRLQRFLLTGKINSVSEIVAFWKIVRDPWRVAIRRSLENTVGGPLQHFRPMVSYARPDSDPIDANYWLDPLAVAWPESRLRPFSAQTWSIFSDEAAAECESAWGEGDRDARVKRSRIWSALHPDESLVCAARGIDASEQVGSLRLLWEAVQCGGDPSLLAIELPAEELGLVPIELAWQREARADVRKQLSSLGPLQPDGSEGRRRLLTAAKKELETIDVYFGFLEQRTLDNERPVP